MRKQRGYKRPAPKPDQVIEFPMVGSTYHRQEFGVYEYGEYPESSVLAGQTRRSFLGSFDTLAEAQKAFPAATFNGAGSGFQEPSLNHLPGDDDPDPKGEDAEAAWAAEMEASEAFVPGRVTRGERLPNMEG